MTGIVDTPEQFFLGQNLILACKIARDDLVEDYLLKGADPDYQGSELTPLLALFSADQSDKKAMLDCLDLLINAGVNVNLENSGRTPLVAASCSHNPQALEKLIAAGAEVNAPDASSLPLGVATKFGYVKNMEVLMHHGANMYLADPDGITPSQFAERFSFGDLSGLLQRCHVEYQVKKQAELAEQARLDALEREQKQHEENKILLRPQVKFRLKKP